MERFLTVHFDVLREMPNGKQNSSIGTNVLFLEHKKFLNFISTTFQAYKVVLNTHIPKKT